jgi:hypothetical protein
MPETQFSDIVRWQVWPKVGVQFDRIPQQSVAQISEFLESLKAPYITSAV